MPDEPDTTEAEETPDTYTPRKTRYVTTEVPAPAGGTRKMRFRLRAGTEYTVVGGEEADERLGYAVGSNVSNLIRASAIPSR